MFIFTFFSVVLYLCHPLPSRPILEPLSHFCDPFIKSIESFLSHTRHRITPSSNPQISPCKTQIGRCAILWSYNSMTPTSFNPPVPLLIPGFMGGPTWSEEVLLLQVCQHKLTQPSFWDTSVSASVQSLYVIDLKPQTLQNHQPKEHASGDKPSTFL